MKKTSLLVCMLAILTLLPACTTVQDSQAWKSTKSFYYNNVNKSATFDYAPAEEMTEPQSLLSANLIRIDQQLEKFQHDFEHLHIPPTAAQLQDFFAEYSWASGVTLIDKDGNVTGSMPETYHKEIDFSRLLAVPATQKEREIRVIVHDDPQGAEIVLGRPIYTPEGELFAVLCVYFDMKNLLTYLNTSPTIFALAGNTPVLLGDYTVGQTPLASIDFVEEAKKSTIGEISSASGTVFWINRYLYHQPLIFAVIQH